MSGRKVVVETPPPGSVPRRAVVVRPGDRGGASPGDIVAGILGTLLLLSTVVLGTTLPDDDVIEPQYRVEFEGLIYPDETKGEPAFSSQRIDDATPQNTYLFPVVFPRDNIYQAEIRVSFNDDVQGSDPDSYRIALISPNGTVYPFKSDETLWTADPIIDPEDETPFAPAWISPPSSTTATIRVVAKPETSFVTPDPADATLDEIQAAAEATHQHGNQGEWTVQVEFVSAGDCPTVDPNADSTHNARALSCMQQHTDANGQQDFGTSDSGNPISVTPVRFSYYTILVEEP